MTSVYDVANQFKTAQDASGVTSYTFDANGNRTTNTWDYENETGFEVAEDG